MKKVVQFNEAVAEEAANEPAMSEDDMKNVLNQLETLKNTNPEIYKKLWQSLGMSSDAELLGNTNESMKKMTESIMKMRTQANEDNLNSDINISKDKQKQPKGITITPTAGFAFKTVIITTNDSSTKDDDKLKIFINFTQHDEIAAPGMKKRLNDEGVEVEGMNIPMSVGALHIETDNKGNACHAYDIIVNPIVITESMNDKTGKYRDFICQLGIQCVENKYKLVLDKRYKLPKLKYFGKTIESQYIQDRKNMPSITEISSSAAPKITNKAAKSTTNKLGTATRTDIMDTDLKHNIYWLQSNNVTDESANSENVMAAIDRNEYDTYTKLPYKNAAGNPVQLTEYIDPTQVLPQTQNIDNGNMMKTRGLVLIAEMQTSQAMNIIQQINASKSNTFIQISPFKLSLKLPQFKKLVLYLPHSILPTQSYTLFKYPLNGAIHTVEMHIVMPMDYTEYALTSDPGSKPWLVSQALSDDNISGDSEVQSSSGTGSGLKANNPYSNNISRHTGVKTAPSTMADVMNQDEHVQYPEDRFHIKLPDDVDQYTGVKLDVSKNDKELIEAMDGKVSLKAPIQNEVEKEAEEEIFAEDRFHAKDASSSYLIQQREQAKKDKWDKYNKEKAEREGDPNVEYVDMDDFRPGGKYATGDKSKEGQDLAALAICNASTTTTTTISGKQELRKAADLVVAATTENSDAAGLGDILSSTLWSELLE